MPGPLVDDLDGLVRDKGFATRSQAVADMVRAGLAEHRTQQGTHAIAGTITLVYDHHKRNIQALLTEIQHDHAEVIISTLHVHLDHDMCMEILAVRGRADHVRETAHRLITAKGVQHGQLTVTVTGHGTSSGSHHGPEHGQGHRRNGKGSGPASRAGRVRHPGAGKAEPASGAVESSRVLSQKGRTSSSSPIGNQRPGPDGRPAHQGCATGFPRNSSRKAPAGKKSAHNASRRATVGQGQRKESRRSRHAHG